LVRRISDLTTIRTYALQSIGSNRCQIRRKDKISLDEV
jgi:hypothetical protein